MAVKKKIARNKCLKQIKIYAFLTEPASVFIFIKDSFNKSLRQLISE